MKHTVEIADSKGTTMRIAVAVDNIAGSGSWRAIDKGMIKHNSGPINRKHQPGWSRPHVNVECVAAGNSVLGMETFISWSVVNDEGIGFLPQDWVLALEPGRISWVVI